MQELSDFMDILEDTDFYYDGKLGDNMKGNLYLIEFTVDNEGSWNGTISMHISDENIVYIEEKQYKIRSEDNELTRYLKSLDTAKII